MSCSILIEWPTETPPCASFLLRGSSGFSVQSMLAARTCSFSDEAGFSELSIGKCMLSNVTGVLLDSWP